jgi:maleate isomerase
MTMAKRIKLGMLTPSCNNILEPVTSAIVANIEGVTAHFGRFKVNDIALSEHSRKQFEYEPMLEAARLLADAKVDVIAWNGTAGGWLGFDNDIKLCALIEKETGIPATSSVLAIDELFRRNGVKRFGLVSPYTGDVNRKIIENFATHGYACTGEERTDGVDGYSFALIPDDKIAGMLRSVAKAKPDASIVFCTNMNGAPLAERIERETGVPIYDSLSATVWKSLRVAGADTSGVKGWGRLFQQAA